MTKEDLLKLLERNAVDYLLNSKRSFRNRHMNRLKPKDLQHLKGRVVEAVIIDFINYVGVEQGVDLGLNCRNIGTNL